MATKARKKTQWKRFDAPVGLSYSEQVVEEEGAPVLDPVYFQSGIDSQDLDLALALQIQEMEQAGRSAGAAVLPQLAIEKAAETAEAPSTATATADGTGEASEIASKEAETSTISHDEDADLALALHLQAQERSDYAERQKVLRYRQGSSQKVRIAYYDDPLDGGKQHSPELERLQHLTDAAEAFGDEEEEGRPTGAARRGRMRGGLYRNEEGKIISKHDLEVCGRRNAKGVEREHDIIIGDVVLPNRAANALRRELKKDNAKGIKTTGRVESAQRATTDTVLDRVTRIILMKLVNAGVLNEIDGCVATGKEANIYQGSGAVHNLHGNGFLKLEEIDISGPQVDYAVKVFRTTLSDFRNRGEYVNGDHRYGENYSKASVVDQIKTWAQKEDANLRRAHRAGVAVPTPIYRRKHVIVMSFIGKDGHPAPQLRLAELSHARSQTAYYEIVNQMRALFQYAHLVHADLSGYNILYHEKKCWLIDFGQAVDSRSHPRALEFLERDCKNITSLFLKKGMSVAVEEEVGVLDEELLYQYIVSADVDSVELPQSVREGLRASAIENPKGAETDSERDEDIELLELEAEDDEVELSDEDEGYTLLGKPEGSIEK